MPYVDRGGHAQLSGCTNPTEPHTLNGGDLRVSYPSGKPWERKRKRRQVQRRGGPALYRGAPSNRMPWAGAPWALGGSPAPELWDPTGRTRPMRPAG